MLSLGNDTKLIPETNSNKKGIKKIRLSRSKFLILFLFIIVFMPQFPNMLNRSEVHINVFSLFFSIIAISYYGLKINRKEFLFLAFYFFLMQILLFLSYFLGSENQGGFGDLFSLIRPLMLFAISLAMLSLLGDVRKTYLTLIKIFKFFVIIIFLYSFCEVVLFEYFSGVMSFFYRIENKKVFKGIAVSFFTLPYFQSYILSMILPFLLSDFSLSKNKKSSFFYVLICLCSIILTQSKMGIFVGLTIIFFYMFLSAGKVKKLVVLFLLSITVAIITIFLLDFVIFLKDEFGGNFSETMHLLLTNTENAGNLMERVRQVLETYNSILAHNIFIGVGLGKGLLIESWIAHILLRYGFIGMGVFVIFFIFISIRAASISGKIKHFDPVMSEIGKAVSIWALMIFFTQLSGLMMEYSKAAVFSSLLFALSAKILFNNEYFKSKTSVLSASKL